MKYGDAQHKELDRIIQIANFEDRWDAFEDYLITYVEVLPANLSCKRKQEVA